MQVMARTGTMSLPVPFELDVVSELIEAGKTDPEIVYYLEGSDVDAYFIHETVEFAETVERLVVLYDGSNEVVLPLITEVNGQEDRLHLGEIRINEQGQIIGFFRAPVLAPTIVAHMQATGGAVQLLFNDTLIKVHHETEEDVAKEIEDRIVREVLDKDSQDMHTDAALEAQVDDALYGSIMQPEEALDRVTQALIDDAKERDELDYEHHPEED